MKIHFVGVGGIGVSALAQYYLSEGHTVSGSDLVLSEITDFLQKKGVKILKGNSAEHITKDLDLVICSPAVKEDCPELKKARKYKIKVLTYPQALGGLTKNYYTIAISGAHGKSTTTAVIGLLLVNAGLDPTVIVGTRVREFGNNNFRKGRSNFLVIEACEYENSFLFYFPKIIVVTNVDREHLDFFKNFRNVKNSFKKFISKLSPHGFLVFNKDDPNILLPSQPSFKIYPYSLKEPEALKLKRILKVPGLHNISNALAVLKVARILGIPDRITFQSLSQFRGTWRRFEIKKVKVNSKRITVISDYGHHPTEVLTTLRAAKEKYGNRKIWCVFQPHQYQRTYYLLNDFIRIFREVPIDEIIITDIYDVVGREEKKIKKKINSQKLVEKIKRENVLYLALGEVENYLKSKVSDGDVLIIMGAGDIYKLAESFGK